MSLVNRVVELVYSSHPRWPFPPSISPDLSRPLNISVLDSSFNPPTLAHLALADSTRPASDVDGDYDARLLLLSVRNADKTLKPGDASFHQRLDMMRLLSADIDNVAVAIIGEPTFVGKSTNLLSFLKHRISNLSNADKYYDLPMHLTFIMGMDTLERFFTPRYYGSVDQMKLSLRTFFSPPPGGEGSYIVCAHRTRENPKVGSLDTQYAREFIDSGRVAMIDIGARESTYSSTAVRESIESGVSSWRTYVTDSIAQYIVEKELYKISST